MNKIIKEINEPKAITTKNKNLGLMLILDLNHRIENKITPTN